MYSSIELQRFILEEFASYNQKPVIEHATSSFYIIHGVTSTLKKQINRHKGRKWSDKEVNNMRKCYKDGVVVNKISKMFKISRSVLIRILKRQSYRDV
jgi:hypothetical protein